MVWGTIELNLLVSDARESGGLMNSSFGYRYDSKDRLIAGPSFFEFCGLWGRNKDYTIHLDEKGTSKTIYSSHTGKDIPEDLPELKQLKGIQVVEVSQKTVGQASYSDFEKIAKYALKRFPDISKEVISSLEKRAKSSPNPFAKNSWEKGKKQAVDAWRRYQKEKIAQFYTTYCAQVIDSKKITAKQAKRLIDLVKPFQSH